VPQIRYTARARQDLLDIWVVIALDDPVAADRVYERLAERVHILERFPQAGAVRPDIDEAARVLVERPYLIFYRLLPEATQIVRVLHGARDIHGILFAEGID
jgi:toxin ParE1/3/4